MGQSSVVPGPDPCASVPSWPHDEVVHAYWVEPGLLAGEYPGHREAAIARRKIDLLADQGIRTFVDLTTAADGLAPYESIVGEVARTRNADLRRVAHPIPDLGVVDDGDYDAILASIAAARDRGGVYVHCWGGIGRTGTVVGCHLLTRGLGYDDAIAALSTLRATSRTAHRPAPETPAQLALLRRRARR